MKSPHGFSLIEMAFVLVIVTLLLGGLLVPFSTQVEQKRIAETQKAMEEIKEALIGYALSHTSTGVAPNQPYLPCPDATITPVPGGGIANDGREDRNGTGCAVAEGNLPWVDLGVSQADVWGNRFHYRVTLTFADSARGFGLSGPGNTGDITVCSTFTNCPASNKLADSLPALVLSYGKNGYGAINANRAAGDVTSIPCPPVTGCSKDEQENFNGDANFVSRTMTTNAVPAGEFDDLVVWLSPNVLFNRMVAAGKLP
jgi:prepilin-type N-terminal cleavage/methylation domain-containing protein